MCCRCFSRSICAALALTAAGGGAAAAAAAEPVTACCTMEERAAAAAANCAAVGAGSACDVRPNERTMLAASPFVTAVGLGVLIDMSGAALGGSAVDTGPKPPRPRPRPRPAPAPVAAAAVDQGGGAAMGDVHVRTGRGRRRLGGTKNEAPASCCPLAPRRIWLGCVMAASAVTAAAPSTEAMWSRPATVAEVAALREAPAHGGSPFAAQRALLDWTYHQVYAPARIALQDAIVSEALATVARCTPASPWLLFVAGAMGTGKTHSIAVLAKRGTLPLHAFVVVDPDIYKGLLPEAADFAREDAATAGTRLHKESALVAELVERAALARGHNVLSQTTFRDVGWYREHIGRLRHLYPRLRLAMMLVTAPREVVLPRVARRALLTGRHVPLAVVDAALSASPLAFTELAPLADFSAHLRNDADGCEPVVEPPITDEAIRDAFAEAACAWMRRGGSASITAAGSVAHADAVTTCGCGGGASAGDGDC